MIENTLLLITQVGMFAFVVAGMAAMGLSLTLPRIVGPLRDVRLLLLLLAANFVSCRSWQSAPHGCCPWRIPRRQR